METLISNLRAQTLWLSRRSTALSALYLVPLLALATYYFEPSLFRSWFFSSDEYVFVAEVIRFLNHDFRQHFFDIPGTPFMFLSAALWALVYHWQAAVGLVPPEIGLQHFTFHHLPALFTMMRGITLSFYLCSVILLFILAVKLTNWVGACVASLVLLGSPIYSYYSSFIRTESLTVCLILISILCLLRGIERLRDSRRLAHCSIFIVLAGFCAGLAAASRFHSITASLPLLLLLLICGVKYVAVYPRWLQLSWKYVFACGFVVCGAAALAIYSGHLPGTDLNRNAGGWHPTLSNIYPFLILSVSAYLIAWTLVKLPIASSLFDRFLPPTVFLLLFGVLFGFFLGTPTLLWQYNYFFESIQMYNNDYIDQTRAHWPLIKNFLWFLHHYIAVIAPNRLSLLLMTIGVLLILVARDRYLVPFVVTGWLFFVSKPINLLPLPHHVIAWLPFWAIVAAYPVAKTYDATRNRHRSSIRLTVSGLTVLIGFLVFNMTSGLRGVALKTAQNEERMTSIASATDWIKKNTEPNATIAISYFCFNPDTFFVWLRDNDVTIPSSVLDGRQYIVWWGKRSALEGLQGYACVSPSDRDAIKFRLDLASPGEGTDPYTDKEFRLLQTYGHNEAQIDIFRFDFLDQSARPSRLPNQNKTPSSQSSN
jgi:hypothetical protein